LILQPRRYDNPKINPIGTRFNRPSRDFTWFYS
jgi:hypothetical protein